MGAACCASTVEKKPEDMPLVDKVLVSDRTMIRNEPWGELKKKLRDPMYPSHKFVVSFINL